MFDPISLRSDVGIKIQNKESECGEGENGRERGRESGREVERAGGSEGGKEGEGEGEHTFG